MHCRLRGKVLLCWQWWWCLISHPPFPFSVVSFNVFTCSHDPYICPHMVALSPNSYSLTFQPIYKSCISCMFQFCSSNIEHALHLLPDYNLPYNFPALFCFLKLYIIPTIRSPPTSFCNSQIFSEHPQNSLTPRGSLFTLETFWKSSKTLWKHLTSQK